MLLLGMISKSCLRRLVEVDEKEGTAVAAAGFDLAGSFDINVREDFECIADFVA